MTIKHTTLGTLNDIPAFVPGTHERIAKAEQSREAALIPDVKNMLECRELPNLAAAELLGDILVPYRRAFEPMFSTAIEALPSYSASALNTLVGLGFLQERSIGSIGEKAYEPAVAIRAPRIRHSKSADSPSLADLKSMLGVRGN
jgi:hypothetical protein